MELIPILSLIILASTISTFVLAIGAYVLYKIRERQGRASAPKPPETIEGEIVAPKAAVVAETKGTSSPLKKPFGEKLKSRIASNGSKNESEDKSLPKEDLFRANKSTSPPIKKPPIFESASFNPRKILSREFTEKTENDFELEERTEVKKDSESKSEGLKWR